MPIAQISFRSLNLDMQVKFVFLFCQIIFGPLHLEISKNLQFLWHKSVHYFSYTWTFSIEMWDVHVGMSRECADRELTQV